MRKAFLASAAALLAATTLAPAQMVPGYPPYPPPGYAAMPMMGPAAYPPPAVAAYPAPDFAPPGPPGYSPGCADGSCGMGYLPGPACAGGCCAPATDCGHADGQEDSFRECWWIHGDYLLWRVKRGSLPVPLATTGGTGVLGAPGTSVVLGDTTLDYRTSPGGRLTTGFWFDPAHPCLGLEGSAFALGRKTVNRGVNSPGPGGLFVPFFDTTTGTEMAFPLRPTGSVTFNSSSRLMGGDLHFIGNLWSTNQWQWIIMAGAQYLDLTEKLDILYGTTAAGVTTQFQDSFHNRNRFYGFEGGTRFDYRFNRWWLEFEEKLSLGITRQELDVVGITTVSGARLLTATFPGGIFAQPANGGSFRRDDLAGVSETTAKVGWVVCKNLSAFAAYDFLFWTVVGRPGDQINRAVPPPVVGAAFTPPTPPALDIHHTGFWAQGIDLGLELRY